MVSRPLSAPKGTSDATSIDNSPSQKLTYSGARPGTAGGPEKNNGGGTKAEVAKTRCLQIVLSWQRMLPGFAKTAVKGRLIWQPW